MIFGSLLVFFLSLLTLVELQTTIAMNVECGEDIEISSDCNGAEQCNSSYDIFQMQLKFTSTPVLELLNLTTVDKNCSENGEFCFTVAKDRKRAFLTMRGVTFTDVGIYKLYFRRSDGNNQKITIHVIVYGVCEPIVTLSEDEFKCEVTMEKTYEPKMQWVSGRNDASVELVKETEKAKTWRITQNPTDENRHLEMCCNASYTQSKTEGKQTCRSPTARSQQLGEDTNKANTAQIVIPILFLGLFAFAVAVYVYCRCRPSFTWPRREKPQEENKEEAQSEPLQRPEDNV